MSKPKLYKLDISPSCQRVFATFAHKGVDYDSVDIDITKKDRPEEFNRLSPFGKVPVLVHENRTLIESAVICQYINDTWPDPPMLPSTPLELAYARRWILYADREIADKEGRMVHIERDKSRKVDFCKEILAGLRILDSELAGKKEFFLGKTLSLVDVILAPSLPYFPIMSRLVGDDHYGKYKNIQAYTERLRQQPVLAKHVFGIPTEALEGFSSAVLVQGLTFP